MTAKELKEKAKLPSGLYYEFNIVEFNKFCTQLSKEQRINCEIEINKYFGEMTPNEAVLMAPMPEL